MGASRSRRIRPDDEGRVTRIVPALNAAKRDGDWHEKPPLEVRSLGDAMKSAERKRAELPKVVQVYARDWDTVIMADAILALRREIDRQNKLIDLYAEQALDDGHF